MSNVESSKSFEVMGNKGMPILCLHGWGQNLHALKPVAELLSVHHTVYLIDLPGFGNAQVPSAPWGSDEYAQWVAEFLREHSLTQVAVVGHSFGGRVAIRLAAQNPALVAGLVLIGSAGLPPRRTFSKALRIRGIRALRRACVWLEPVAGSRPKEWHSQRFGSSDFKNAGAMRPTLVRLLKEDQSSDASIIKAPTLLIWGAKDPETPLDMALRFKQLLSSSELIVLPNAGHFPYLTSPDLCAYYIRQFLSEPTDGQPREGTSASTGLTIHRGH